MWTLNLGKTANIPKLNETMAIELGANLLGEFVIYSIGAGLLIFEYVRFVIIHLRISYFAFCKLEDIQCLCL